MAQLERRKRISESPKSPKSQTSPTFEQLLRVEEAYWSTSTSPTLRISHDLEECPSPSHNKKSVLTKVKERAKKLRQSLSGKKKHEIDPSNDHSTPSWGVTLDDDYDDEPDDDPEYLGAPMYESEAAPESLKETARQHPRAVPVVSENHRAPNRVRNEVSSENDKPVSPSMTMTDAVSEKLAPAYAAMSDATHKIASKLAGLAIATQETQERPAFPSQIHGGSHETQRNAAQIAVSMHQGSEAKKMSENAGNLKQYTASSPQTWDKGVSVKEYFLNKLEPGEDERALSQAITEAISPRKTTGDTGVVEKVKEAVTAFFWQEQTSNSMAKAASLSSAVPASSNMPTSTQQNRITSTNTHSSKVLYPASANSSPSIPHSSNAHEVHDEENHGKILQAN